VILFPESETAGSENFQSPILSNVFAMWRNVIGHVAAVNSGLTNQNGHKVEQGRTIPFVFEKFQLAKIQ
jgi:hypothetical protein